MSRCEEIKNILSTMDSDKIIRAYNKCCLESGRTDECIYMMGEFDDILEDFAPSDIAWSIYRGIFDIRDKYFRFGVCSELLSFNYWDDSVSGISLDSIANFGDDDSSLNADEIVEIFTDYN